MSNMRELAENKLIILYILDRAKRPLTQDQITEIVQDGKYMNYFIFMQNLNDLVDGGYVEKNNHMYSITLRGVQILNMFKNKLPESTMKNIDEYIALHRESFKRDTEIFAEYYKISDKQYITNLKVIENEMVLIELNLNVPTSEQAMQICKNWKYKAKDIYPYLMNSLGND
ncbi:MAG: DUF4364 family protein [Thermoanaerobacteraceae bacterium]|nr:DUF4364 family protein [Thermoanaerobacteraceae bacterium]